MAAAEEMEMEMGFEATELRLGLPSSREEAEAKNSSKRGFLETMDLNLKLETSDNTVNSTRIATVSVNEGMKRVASKKCLQINSNIDDPAKPSAPKSQVVGWPPVRSYRKNIMSEKGSKEESGSAQAAFVKVSMDGAPYLRKVDLKVYRSYQELYISLEKMFSSSTIHFMNGSKIMDLLNGSEYVPTYEDKDGDWMLVGDVPWEMFVESCKRLRIMKGSEAIGLAPRAVEKCKDQS